jgi:PAS domain S-box-containing protein
VSAAVVSEGALRTAIEVCPVAIIMAEPVGTIMLANREVERMFGYERDELLGHAVEILVPTRLFAQYAEHRLGYAVHPEPRSLTDRSLRGLRKNGTEFPVEVRLNPVQTINGMLVLGIVSDITERLRTDRVKDEFVTTVSHELRTPLTSIAGALGLLVGNAGGTLPAPALRLLTIARANSQRLIRLVNGILDMEKIESGKIAFVQKQVEIRALIGQAIEANRGFADEYGVSIRLDATSVAAVMRADPDWLTQIVTNLLSNAVKFSPQGGEVLVAIEKAGTALRVSVSDHGSGIPEEFKPRVFEKFAQADNSHERQRGGTGLGLSIVKQIVARLGGRVEFDDVPGGGTVFHVDLPCFENLIDDPPATAA